MFMPVTFTLSKMDISTCALSSRLISSELMDTVPTDAALATVAAAVSEKVINANINIILSAVEPRTAFFNFFEFPIEHGNLCFTNLKIKTPP
jgi:hypothetical protein